MSHSAAGECAACGRYTIELSRGKSCRHCGNSIDGKLLKVIAESVEPMKAVVGALEYLTMGRSWDDEDYRDPLMTISAYAGVIEIAENIIQQELEKPPPKFPISLQGARPVPTHHHRRQ